MFVLDLVFCTIFFLLLYIYICNLFFQTVLLPGLASFDAGGKNCPDKNKFSPGKKARIDILHINAHLISFIYLKLTIGEQKYNAL